MIELISLQFGNIRSFVDDQFISFENREKLIQIDGKNENTGGSSGAGKSTVLMALLYVFDIGDIPTTVLQSRLTKDGIWGIVKARIDGVEVTISRSKKEGLKIELPGETVSGNSKLAEEKLDQLIGLPRKVFKKMVHKKQKESGFFLSMTPKEMYEFLISVLGLEKYIVDIDKITANLSESIKAIEDLTRDLQLSNSSLADLERILSEKKKPEPVVHDDEIKQLNHGVLALRSNIGALKLELKQMIDEIPKPEETTADTSEINNKIALLVPERAELNKKLEGIDASKKNIEAELNKIPFAVRDAQKAGEEIKRIRDEKEHMEKSQCPTCLQKWVGDTVSEKITKADANIAYFIAEALKQKAIIDSKQGHQDNLNRLMGIREGINGHLQHLQEKRAKLDAEKYALMEANSTKNQRAKEEYSNKCLEIEAKLRNTLDKLNTDLKQVEIDLAGKESQKNQYNVSLAQYERETASLNDLLSKKRQHIAEIDAKTASLRSKIIVAEESKRMLKAYVLQTFQETLDAIGHAATEILAGVPNMATSTIYFEGCKETKSGTIKDEIVAIINMDGTNEIPIKSLSGGEETTTHLAVDLAVIDVIETKVAKGANFFFMDEPFDGLDTVCKENSLEILKQLDTNKKIIMVDHSSELKEMVSDVILVVKKGETSTISA